MKAALFVYGGWDGHEPKQCVEAVAPLLEQQGFRVEMADRLDVFEDAEALRRFDLLVPCWSFGNLSAAAEEALVAVVRQGVGLGGWHGGLCDAFRDRTLYQFMTGGQFVAHPGNIRRYRIEIAQPHDPIMAGLADFELDSEQYYLHVDPAVEVLATTTFGPNEEFPESQGVVMPAVWKRRWGQGKVFYCAAGHVAADFDVPELKEIVRRGLLWAAR